MILCASTIVTGDGKTVLTGNAILLNEAGSIKKIGYKEELMKQFPDEKIVDYGNASILPGLFDMHVHFGYFYSQPDKDDYDDFMLAYYALQQAKYALQLGITTIRDTGSKSGLLKQLRNAGTKGYVNVPRIIHCDRGITMTGGHGHQDGHEEVDGSENIRHVIRRQIRDGADWVKILTSNREDTPEFTQEELDAAVDECHRRRKKIAVHAGTHPSIQMCIDAGFDTIEHGTFMTLEQAKQMAQKGQAWTPTMTAYIYLYEQTKKMMENHVGEYGEIEARAIRDQYFFEPAANAYKNNFKKLYDTGVIVLAGSDMVLYQAPPLPIHQELSYMVQFGITPVQAIQTATGNPAKVLDLYDQVGIIEEGRIGDLLVVAGDVSKDIQMLDRIVAVYQKGKIVFRGNGNE